MDSLTVRLGTSLAITAGKSSDLTTVQDSGDIKHTKELTFGSSSGQANKAWHDQRTLSATSEELDLSGSLTDSFGDTVTLSKVKMLMIENKATTSGHNLVVGGAASNGFATIFGDSSDEIIIPPGGILLLTSPVDGFTVTGGTGDLLKIDSGANNITYNIAIIGN